MNILSHRRIRSWGARAASRPRRGVSIVEIVVALTLFGAVAVAMGGMSLVVARRADANDVFTKRTAVLQQQMNLIQALPYDEVVKRDGTTEITDGPFPHTRDVTVEQNGSHTRVTLKITPKRAPGSAETITFDRAKPTTSPLCKGC